MKILTAWAHDGDPDHAPWLIAAVDEYTIEEHGGLPDFYLEARKSDWTMREIWLDVAMGEIDGLFIEPTVRAQVVRAGKQRTEPEE